MKIRTFNFVFWLCVFITLVFAYLFRLYFLKFGLEKAIKAFYIIHIFEVIFYLVYKIALCNDKEYEEICYKCGNEVSTYLSEIIPLQLCNVSYIVIPLAFLTKNPHLFSYGMLVTPLGTIIALLFPCTGLTDDSIFKLRIAGYYFTHLYLIFMSLVVWTLNPIALEYADAFRATISVVIISLIAHIVNVIFVKTKICPNSNYFFTLNPNVNPFLAKIYNIFPVKWLYEIPLFVIAYLILSLIVFILKLI